MPWFFVSLSGKYQVSCETKTRTSKSKPCLRQYIEKWSLLLTTWSYLNILLYFHAIKNIRFIKIYMIHLTEARSWGGDWGQKFVCIQCACEPKRLLFTGDSDTDVCIPTKLRNPTPWRDPEGLMGGGVCDLVPACWPGQEGLECSYVTSCWGK